MNRIIATLATVSLFSPALLAAEVEVPDSGGTVGLFALGILLVIAFRRKFSK